MAPSGTALDLILHQLADLFLHSIPTAVLFLLLLGAYRVLVHAPLMKVLAERQERTTGAMARAEAAIRAGGCAGAGIRGEAAGGTGGDLPCPGAAHAGDAARTRAGAGRSPARGAGDGCACTGEAGRPKRRRLARPSTARQIRWRRKSCGSSCHPRQAASAVSGHYDRERLLMRALYPSGRWPRPFCSPSLAPAFAQTPAPAAQQPAAAPAPAVHRRAMGNRGVFIDSRTATSQNLAKAEQEDEEYVFKHSASVRAFAKLFHLSPDAASMAFWALNATHSVRLCGLFRGDRAAQGLPQPPPAAGSADRRGEAPPPKKLKSVCAR